MEKFCLYLDKNENLIFSKISEGNIITDKDIVGINQSTYKYIDYLATKKIMLIEELSQKNTLNIKYQDIILTILDAKEIIKKGYLRGIAESVKSYIKREELKHKGKKITRKNKYRGAFIIAGGMVISLLAGIGSHSLSKNDKNNDFDSSNGITTKSDELENDNSDKKNETNDSPDIYYELYNKLYNTTNNSIKYMENNSYSDIQKIYVDFEDRSLDNKAITTKQLYQELIEKYSKIYGVDKNLILAIATQERGIHSQDMDAGGATGLMQIQNAIWDNQELSAYNFVTGQYEKVIVNVNDLSDLEYNIKIGTMILQNTLTYMNYNLCAAIQCYNMGYGNMRTILTQYASDSGKTIQEVLENNDLGWLEYRNLINEGDQYYLEHVMSWIGNDFIIGNQKPDGGMNVVYVSRLINEKKVNFN